MPKLDPSTCWKVHSRSLIEEVIKGSGQPIYKIPLTMLYRLLQGVAREASRLNDPRLNALMCKLALYAVADPEDKEHYNPKLVDRIFCRADRIHQSHVRKMGTKPSNPGKATGHRQANRPKAPTG